MKKIRRYLSLKFKKYPKLKILFICFTGFITMILFLLFFVVFAYVYNEIIKPFERKKYYLKEEINNDVLIEDDFYNFYVKEKFDDYNTIAYERDGSKSFLPQYTLIFSYYAEKSSSIIINLGDDFYNVNNKNIIDIEFIKIPLVDSNDQLYYIDSIQIDDWTFYRIKVDGFRMNLDEEIDGNKIGVFFYGFNPQSKLISYSFLSIYSSIGFPVKDSKLKKYISVNLLL